MIAAHHGIASVICSRLQCAGEEQGLAPLQDDVMDQLIHKPVVRDFLFSLAGGMGRVLASICMSWQMRFPNRTSR